MKIVKFLFILIITLYSCKKDEEIDKEKPKIDLSMPNTFPTNCDTIYFGEPFDLKLLFSDNSELGSYSISIHNNFDHHSHSTEVMECSLDSKKEAVNPFLFIEDYKIPEGSKTHETAVTISIQPNNNIGIFDEGDYHFFISLTDKEGWSEQKGLSIKMRYR